MSRVAAYFIGDPEQTVRGLVSGQPDFIAITTPSSAGAELEISHGLGRIPNGYAIVKRPYTGTAPDHGGSGTAWTSEKLFLKFTQTDVDMTIAVF